jgi:hypothetical protein
MGWLGIGWVGAVVGFVGWRLQPTHAARRWWWSVLAGALAAALAKMAGNVIGLYDDGDTLEWLIAVGIAMAAVALVGVLFPRPHTS